MKVIVETSLSNYSDTTIHVIKFELDEEKHEGVGISIPISIGMTISEQLEKLRNGFKSGIDIINLKLKE
jgi:hypothetical protein